MKSQKVELPLAIKLAGQLRIVTEQQGNFVLPANSAYYEGLQVIQEKASLLAAAPELLEALKRVTAQYEAFCTQNKLEGDQFHRRLDKDCHRAIAKATGGK